ncbi:nad-binding protein [Colletotrichum kahawae]|uniref:Nad-binding protein n=1 Tax=Colletotrichum kahawae TaxID=34407 RepID=A0AAD9YKX6_COLKA|nr:nad-binding protein [Colletotrichum kahawae]
MRVGFLGLGVMGTPMALNLTRKFAVTVWNRTPSKYLPLTQAGAKIGETPAKVAEQSDVIFAMLFDGAALLDPAEPDLGNCSGKAGDLGRALARDTLTSIFNDDFRGALRGKTLINTASIPVDTSKYVAAQVQKAGGNFIEMPVSGSKIPAEQGRLVGLLAGDPKIAEQMRPYVEPLTAAAIYCGPIGFGLKTKYAVNLYLNNMTAALAESFSLAKAQGLNLEAFGQVIDAGPMASAYTKVKIPKIVNSDWAPQAAVKDCYNSTQLIVKAAEDANVRTPYAELCRQVYKEATEAGLNEEDMIAVYKLFQNPR